APLAVLGEQLGDGALARVVDVRAHRDHPTPAGGTSGVRPVRRARRRPPAASGPRPAGRGDPRREEAVGCTTAG
ncbi:MAG TPA: hypothetical protein VF667_11620, partial [Pseudonocardia sp.]